MQVRSETASIFPSWRAKAPGHQDCCGRTCPACPVEPYSKKQRSFQNELRVHPDNRHHALDRTASSNPRLPHGRKRRQQRRPVSGAVKVAAARKPRNSAVWFDLRRCIPSFNVAATPAGARKWFGGQLLLQCTGREEKSQLIGLYCGRSKEGLLTQVVALLRYRQNERSRSGERLGWSARVTAPSAA